MAPKKPAPEPERREAEAPRPKRPTQRPQPMLSDADMALLTKKYAKLGFKKGMSFDELNKAMDKLAEKTPLSKSNEDQAGEILGKIQGSMMAAVDAVKNNGTADRSGATPEEVEAELEAVRTDLEAALKSEKIKDREVIEASRLVLEFKIKEKGLQEREDERLQMKAPSKDMKAALKGVNEKPLRGGRHVDDAADFEPPRPTRPVMKR